MVDTGVAGSEPEIEAALGALGVGWEAVGHVILTHRHPDHVGSLGGVLELAPEASVYAGEADIPNIASTIPPQPVGDGDRVFDLDIISTPGHTLGHISVHDPASGVLVAGDALNGMGSGMPMAGDGVVAGANPRFSVDMALADETVRKLAGLDYETLYFGHGEPVLEDAVAAVAALASTLG